MAQGVRVRVRVRLRLRLRLRLRVRLRVRLRLTWVRALARGARWPSPRSLAACRCAPSSADP